MNIIRALELGLYIFLLHALMESREITEIFDKNYLSEREKDLCGFLKNPWPEEAGK